jgi:hypothetical protein
MSSTCEIQLSDAEIKALTAKIEAISSKEKILAKPALQALLSLINKPADISPLLCRWISQIQLTENVVKVFRPVLPIPASVRD